MPRWYTPTMHVRQIGRGSLVINRRAYTSQSTSYSLGGRTVSKLHHTLRSIGYLKYLGMVILSLGMVSSFGHGVVFSFGYGHFI